MYNISNDLTIYNIVNNSRHQYRVEMNTNILSYLSAGEYARVKGKQYDMFTSQTCISSQSDQFLLDFVYQLNSSTINEKEVCGVPGFGNPLHCLLCFVYRIVKFNYL